MVRIAKDSLNCQNLVPLFTINSPFNHNFIANYHNCNLFDSIILGFFIFGSSTFNAYEFIANYFINFNTIGYCFI